LAQAAYQRQELPLDQRKPFFLYIDEFHSFTTEAFADMLSSLRKYGFGIIATTQYLSGMSDKVRDAVFGNVGNIIAFRLGAPDASVLVRHFGYDIPSVSDLVNLPNYECYVRMIIDGAQSKPFSARTMPMPHMLSHLAA
jgi:DNA helicase HerA-like ATPase